MSSIRLDQTLADDDSLLLVGQVVEAPSCRVLRAEISAPSGARLSFVEAPTDADGRFRLVLPLGPLTASERAARPCAGPFRLRINCAADPRGPAWPEPGKLDIVTLNCRPSLRLMEAPVDGACVGGDGPPMRVLRPSVEVRRRDRLGDIVVAIEVLTGSVVRERKILVCRGEESRYTLTTEFRVPGGYTVSWRAGLLAAAIDGPLTDVQAAAPITLQPCLDPPPGIEPPQDPWKPPGWCTRLPIRCGQLLALWRTLLLIALFTVPIALALAPPDWAVRVAAYLVMEDTKATVGKGVQIILGAAGGTAGSPTGTLGSGAGSTAGAALTEAQRRTVDAIIGFFDGFVVLAGFFVASIGGVFATAGLVALVLWWLCCGRASRCAIWTQLAWVLEAAIVVALPAGGTLATLIGTLVANLGGPAAAGRAGTALFLQLVGGIVITTLIYGFVRWRRDVNRCPVRPLWLWPWKEAGE